MRRTSLHDVLGMLVAAATLLGAPAAASAIDLCVGDHAVIRGPSGSVWTYTPAIYGMGWPAMQLECSVQEALAAGGNQVAAWALQPNANVLLAADPTDKQSAANNAPLYLDILLARTPRLVVTGRSAGTTEVTVWQRDANGQVDAVKIPVHVHSCGASSRHPSPSAERLCEGSVVEAPGAIHQVRGDAIEWFPALDLRLVAGMHTGKARMLLGNPGGVSVWTTTVYPAGIAACAPRSILDPMAVTGHPHDFELVLCAGETWVNGLTATPAAVAVPNGGVEATLAATRHALALHAGHMPAETDVYVLYAQPELPAIHYHVNVVSCE